MKFKSKTLGSCMIILACMAAATGIGWLFRFWNFPETNVVIVYILFVVLTARFTDGYVYGILSSIIATCAFNMFFTSPYFTLSVSNPTYLITFVIMTITSVITSTLTAKAKENAKEAQEKEAAARALYHLTNRLTNAKNMEETLEIASKSISKVAGCFVTLKCFSEEEREHFHNDNKEMSMWLIRGKKTLLGVVLIPRAYADQFTESKKKVLRSMLESIALVMERHFSEQERMKVREEVVQERYRGNLLRAISHDLRTPLSGIMGTSEMLMAMTDADDERHHLAEHIYKDAGWLHALMENILNLTRMQDGRLVLEKQVEAVEEVIETAIAAMGKRAPERDIVIDIPEEMLLVPMDARLIGQVLINLLDNAVKHTEKDQEIALRVRAMDNQVQFSVLDRGTGITEEDLPKIFEMFYTKTKKRADASRGMGLGLAICESIVTAHGGMIWAKNREDGNGAEFTFTLPMSMGGNES